MLQCTFLSLLVLGACMHAGSYVALLRFSAPGLLPVLPDYEPKVAAFFRTPVGDDRSTLGLASQPSVRRFREEEEFVLFKTSPRGPPMVGSQDIGTQPARRWFPPVAGSISRDSLRGESAAGCFSWSGGEDEDETLVGIEMESWVLSDDFVASSVLGQAREGSSSMKWRRGWCC